MIEYKPHWRRISSLASLLSVHLIQQPRKEVANALHKAPPTRDITLEVEPVEAEKKTEGDHSEHEAYQSYL